MQVPGHIISTAKGITMKKLLLLLILSQTLTACAVYMAANQPDAKNTSLFMNGTDRHQLLAEFGNPQFTEIDDDGKKREVFVFTQGYSAGTKFGRAIFHGAADFFTLGLWEIIATPLEGYFDGNKKAFEVIYDANGKIEHISPIKGTNKGTDNFTNGFIYE